MNLILPHGSVRGLYRKKEHKKRKKNVGGSFTGKREHNKNEIKKTFVLEFAERKKKHNLST
jgi:hypothetical protein